MGQGAGGSMRVEITVGGVVGSSSAALSYGGPLTVLASSQVNLAWNGSVGVTVEGSGFGKQDGSARGRVGQTGCEGTSWISESSMVGLAGRGVERSAEYTMTVGQQVGSSTEVVSYDVSLGSSSVPANVMRGGVLTTLTGGLLGLFDSSVSGAAGGTACEATSWVSESAARCLVAAGLGVSQRLTVTVGASVGSLTHALTFDGGVMSSTARQNVALGSVAVTVSGDGMGGS
eukprot:2095655-Rhodomonas_salina.1